MNLLFFILEWKRNQPQIVSLKIMIKFNNKQKQILSMLDKTTGNNNSNSNSSSRANGNNESSEDLMDRNDQNHAFRRHLQTGIAKIMFF